MDQESASLKAHRASQTALEEGYRQMAADSEQEMEAAEWVEALIGDVDPAGAEPGWDIGLNATERSQEASLRG